MHVVKRLWEERLGNFGIMTALLMVPVMGAAGMAVDFGRALSLRTELVGAADAAAVGAIAEKSKAVAQAMSMSGDGSVPLDTTEANRIFMSQMSGELSKLPLTVDIAIVKNNGIISSRVSFKAEMPTAFMRILGKDQVAVSGVATAVFQAPAFMDFFMLLDNTPSMGVGATPHDIKTMQEATRLGSDGKGKDANCAFACHIVSEAGVEDPKSYYNVAKNNNVTTRIDVVAAATKALMTKATDTQTVANQFRIAAYTFGKTAMDAKLFKVAGLNYNLGEVAKATDQIELMSIPKQNYNNDQQTSFDDALKGINGEIDGTPGKGTSNTDRQKIVFFVADGVGDSAKSKGCTSPKGTTNGTRCIEPIDTQACQTLKDRGIRIAVLYTTYLELPENDFYKKWVAPFQSQIATKMQECATPGFYFEVSPTEGIEKAMQTLFLKIVTSPRITS
ncbi:TadE/TadG family type IV pilus assembly protein [Rhizobium terrae]|uniref:TadE/TadG family type IV pilus assembly protein n=1 Tax=Rhizobium terrae TaxID=2171756 RepID=UPI000E3BC8FF|nr:pilus assembly protein TadG-related protein [Rhizobium terrae]